MAPRARRIPADTVAVSDHVATLARVRKFLLARGASAEEIDEAEQRDLLDLLMADRMLVPAERRFNEAEVSARTAMPVELARKFWRALGFADPQPDDRIFTDLDIEAIKTIHALLDLGVTDLDHALQLARVIGSSMSRIAEAEVSPAVVGSRMFGPLGAGDSVEAADLFSQLADQILPTMGALMEFVWRRHLQAAAHRAMLLRRRQTGPLPALCVGFADMVGFTTLSQQLSEEELANVVSRFEEVAHSTVTGGGGRLVKMIGDEAMFVSESAVSAARVALALAEAYADDELLSDVRVGLAEGPVLVQEGDYYGPVVNLAHAVVGLADPSTVLLSDDFHTALLHELHPSGSEHNVAEGEFAFRAVRPRTVKDVGRVQLWVLHRPGTTASKVSHRMGQRWERLAEVMRDIEELRDRGERLLTAGLRVAVGPDSEEPDLGPESEQTFVGSGAEQPDGGDAERA